MALVSAANTTPSYQNKTHHSIILVNKTMILHASYIMILFFSYLIDDTADSSTGLHGFDGLRHAGGFGHGLVADAVVEVEAPSRQSVQVV